MSAAVAQNAREAVDRITQDTSTALRQTILAQVMAARRAQRQWSQSPLWVRARLMRAARHAIAERADLLADAIELPFRRRCESLAAEVIPLADACRFLELQAAEMLRPKSLNRRGRPFWMRGVDIQLRREPHGVVLLVGPSNYPLFLIGVQCLQAFVAGNAVLIKPAEGCSRPLHLLLELLLEAGLDQGVVQVLPETPHAVHCAIEAGVDKFVLTGSADTGRHVQQLLAETLTPSTLELSGCDAAFVLESADLEHCARCLAFGLCFNGGATCIAPHRVFVHKSRQAQLERLLIRYIGERHDTGSTCPLQPSTVELVRDAIDHGARLIAGSIDNNLGHTRSRQPIILTEARTEMRLLKDAAFGAVAAIVPVEDESAALAADALCPFALGATVFGDDARARQLASRIDAGCVVVNDMLVPTADPRVPFGGRKLSGFGCTRGADGLVEMTQLKTVITRRGRPTKHLQSATPGDAEILAAYLGLAHGRGISMRLKSGRRLVHAILSRRRNGPRGDQIQGASPAADGVTAGPPKP